jgi:DNA-binding response OmpR family regulator
MTAPLALIIEDDEELATIFSESIRLAGFTPEIIHDGSEALTRIAETTARLIVLDLHLPHASGEEILHQIRADSHLKETPIIIATADPHMAEILRHEADLVLIKPISFGQLRDLAKRLAPPNILE